MSIWSNILAPELFKNYNDWYDNFVSCMRREPSEDCIQQAKNYFFDQTVKGILGIES